MDPLQIFNEMYLEYATEKELAIELGIAELKRKGFTQLDAIKVLMYELKMSAVEADERVRKSLAWQR